MRKRILTNWTFSRAIYLIMGIAIIIQSVMSKHWFGIALGIYFASMGLFAFGCASGNCFGGSCQSVSPSKTNTSNPDLEVEEVKTK